MIYPEFPKLGQKIGICAPSAGVGDRPTFDISEESIRSLGLDIVETKSVRSIENPSCSAEIRGEEFNQLSANPDIKMIISATGGEYNIEMLPYINIESIIKQPKWFVGYSDPTNISYFITTKMDIATIYGVNAGSFDSRPLHENQKNALDILSGNIPVQHSYELWDSSRDFESTSYDTPVSWDLYTQDGLARKAHEFKGRLIGGCTDVIDALIGTPYDGTSDFINKYKDDGIIWYFDTFEINPFNLYLFFVKMKFAGYLENAKVIILGRVMLPGNASDKEYIELIRRAIPDIPFIWNADVGHTKPSMTLINGAMAELKTANGKAELQMSLK